MEKCAKYPVSFGYGLPRILVQTLSDDQSSRAGHCAARLVLVYPWERYFSASAECYMEEQHGPIFPTCFMQNPRGGRTERCRRVPSKFSRISSKYDTTTTVLHDAERKRCGSTPLDLVQSSGRGGHVRTLDKSHRAGSLVRCRHIASPRPKVCCSLRKLISTCLLTMPLRISRLGRPPSASRKGASGGHFIFRKSTRVSRQASAKREALFTIFSSPPNL